jgi:CRP-like cAMP-binding protein
MQTVTDLIHEQPLFHDLDPAYVDLLSGCARNEVFEQGGALFREGEPAGRFWLLRRGRVALRITAPGRPTIVIDTIGPGEVLGWSWLVPPYRWTFDGEAIELTRAIGFDAGCVRGKFDADPRLGYEMLRRFVPLIQDRLQATRLRLLDIYGNGTR